MDPEKFRNKKQKVIKTRNVEISLEYLNPDYYEPKLLPYRDATPTGLVKVGKITPKKPDLPEFLLRCDKNGNALDVDIYKDSKISNNLWRKSGYKGHHTKKIDSGKRIFEVDIRIPGRRIIQGKINMELFFEQVMKVESKVKPKLIYKVHRAKKGK